MAPSGRAAVCRWKCRTSPHPDFRDGSRLTRCTAGKAAGILARNGIYLGEHLRSWLQSQLDEYGVRTFADLPCTDDDRDFLHHSGRRAAEKFLDCSSTRPPWDFEAYIAAHR